MALCHRQTDGRWLLLGTLKDDDGVRQPPFDAIEFPLSDLWADPPEDTETESRETWIMRYLHTMLRITDLDDSLDFFCDNLGLVEISRKGCG